MALSFRDEWLGGRRTSVDVRLAPSAGKYEGEEERGVTAMRPLYGLHRAVSSARAPSRSHAGGAFPPYDRDRPLDLDRAGDGHRLLRPEMSARIQIHRGFRLLAGCAVFATALWLLHRELRGHDPRAI